jgi:hypothetical protein
LECGGLVYPGFRRAAALRSSPHYQLQRFSAAAKIIVILKLGRSLPELKDLSQSIVTKHRLRRRSH